MAKTADMTIWNMQGHDTDENPVCIPISEFQLKECITLQGSYKSMPIAKNAEHLNMLLIGTFKGWERYRDQVIFNKVD